MKHYLKKISSSVLIFALVFSGLTTGTEIHAKAKPVLSKRKISLKVGKTATLKVKKTKKKVKWTQSSKKYFRLSNKKKLSVKIKAVKAGTAKVYAKVAGKKLTCKVTVTKKATVTKKPVVTNTPGIVAGPTATPAPSSSPVPRGDDIKILYSNDVHCGISDNIGYAGLSLYKKELKEKTPYVTLVDAGDAVQGAPIGSLTKGEAIVDIMNQVGYDFAIPGNHEFDYGMAQFKKLASKMNCQYYSCNFIESSSGKNVLDSYKMVDYGSTKVAYIGATTPDTLSSANPTTFQDDLGNYIYSFCESTSGDRLYNKVQDTVDAVRKAGADYVVLVCHLGENGVTDQWSSDSVIQNTTGINVCIDGHSHETVPSNEVKNKSGENVLVTQTGTKLSNIGELTINTKGEISTKLVTEVPATSDATILENGKAVDTATKTYIDGIQEEFKELLKTEIGSTSFDLEANALTDSTIRLVRMQETNLGDLTADAYREMMGAQIGLSNGGGVRDNILTGKITYNDAYKVFPFGNTVCAVEATGQQILDCLEMGARKLPETNGEFMQVSGITFTIDASVESNVKVDEKGNFISVDGAYRVQDVKVDGEAMDLTKTYTVAAVNYFLKSYGGGMTMFQNAKLIKDEVMTDVDSFVKFIEKLGGTIPERYKELNGQKRIQIIQAKTSTETQVSSLKNSLVGYYNRMCA